jgi:flavin reductase (DIM6/NTAB) family NADH-FMN oxidoreductase RutF
LNYLAKDQSGVARMFAEHVAEPEEKFKVGGWTLGPFGNPVLAGSLATMECTVRRRVDEGTHSIFIGAVVAVDAGHKDAPLVYARSTYARVGGLA